VRAVQIDRLELLTRTLGQTTERIAAIGTDQRAVPTPCADWDMHTLVTHVIEDLRRFTRAAQGEKVDWSQPPQPLDGDDWTAEFDRGAQQLLDTWRAAPTDALPRVDQAVTELAVHGWDITKATRQPLSLLDDEIAEYALAWSKPRLKPEYRGAAFGAEVPVPDDAPAQDRLAGWFGRNPGWSPPQG